MSGQEQALPSFHDRPLSTGFSLGTKEREARIAGRNYFFVKTGPDGYRVFVIKGATQIELGSAGFGPSLPGVDYGEWKDTESRSALSQIMEKLVIDLGRGAPAYKLCQPLLEDTVQKVTRAGSASILAKDLDEVVVFVVNANTPGSSRKSPGEPGLPKIPTIRIRERTVTECAWVLANRWVVRPPLKTNELQAHNKGRFIEMKVETEDIDPKLDAPVIVGRIKQGGVEASLSYPYVRDFVVQSASGSWSGFSMVDGIVDPSTGDFEVSPQAVSVVAHALGFPEDDPHSKAWEMIVKELFPMLLAEPGVLFRIDCEYFIEAFLKGETEFAKHTCVAPVNHSPRYDMLRSYAYAEPDTGYERGSSYSPVAPVAPIAPQATTPVKVSDLGASL